MRRPLIGIFVLASAALFLSAADGDDLPEGEGKEVVETACVACHGLAQVTSARYSKKFWESLVDDMITRGADVADDDVPVLVNYLSRNFGKPVNINTSSAKEIEDGLSFTSADSETIVRYRTDQGPFKTYDDLVKIPGIDTKLLEEQKKNIVF